MNLPEFDRSLPMVLIRALDATRQAFRPALHAAGLTEAQWRVLRSLADVEEAAVSEVAGRCALQLPSMTRIVRHLTEAGLVTRRTDPADQRRGVLRITEAGRTLVRAVAPAVADAYAALEERLGDNGVDDLIARLARLEEPAHGDAQPADRMTA